MLSVFSICLFGNNIGVHYILIGIVLLLFVLFVVVIGGNIYDMRGDILASMKEKKNGELSTGMLIKIQDSYRSVQKEIAEATT